MAQVFSLVSAGIMVVALAHLLVTVIRWAF